MTRLICSVLVLALLGCADPSVPQQKEVASGIRVTVTLPKQRSIDYVLIALGSVESIHHPIISAETSGQIVKIEVSEGESVVAKQLLASIDNTLHAIEADKAAAQLQRQEVLLENQQRTVDRLLQLAKSQSVSRDRLEDEQAQLHMLVALRDVAVKQEQRALYLESKTRVLAPREGRITRRHISPGDYVTAGQPLFGLVSVKRLRARLAFPEHRAASIAIGQQVSLHSPAAPATVASGVVGSINPRINPRSRSLDVIVEFDNPGGWYPGASVDAALVVGSSQNAVTIPVLSVVRRDGNDVVFVVDGDHASQRTVELGWREDGWVEILAGLAVRDAVVVEGSALVTDGSPLLVIAQNPAP